LSATDWIALVQALFLAAAAFFGGRALQARRARASRGAGGGSEGTAARLTRRCRPRVQGVSERLADARSGSGPIRGGHGSATPSQYVALAFLPVDAFILFGTKALTECSPSEVQQQQLDKAQEELLRLFAAIVDGEYSIRQVALPSVRAKRDREAA
jgi:hypothetical protein